MKKSVLVAFMIASVISLFLGGLGQRPAAAGSSPDKIVFGQSLSLSGRLTPQTSNLEQPAVKLWYQEVNAKGGIYVKEYGKRLPVELIQYDDKSDPDTMIKLLKKLITVDKVDFLFPPHGTDMHFPACPLANKYGHILVTWTSACAKLYDEASKNPYIFHAMVDYRQRYSELKDLFLELGVKSVAIIYIQGLMGIEISKYLAPACEDAGLEVVMKESFPIVSKDLSPLLKQVKRANVDAVVSVTYPGTTLLITEQSMVIGLNPKLFFVDIGGAMPFYRDKFGASKLEGVMSEGGWNPKMSSQAQEYSDKYKKLNGREPDFFSAPYGYATYQVYEQAIEKAGTLDRDKVRAVMTTETFNTVNGPIKFEGQINRLYPSAIGQWQKGVFEAIGPKKTRTAKPLYPKWPWPQ